MRPPEGFAYGVGLFGVGVLLGFVLLCYRGLPMLLLGGYLYTGGPKGYKYLALGDVLVFLLMGPLMVVGSYYALTGGLTLTVFLASLPVGSLVAAIMAINNHRDAATDREAEVRTLSNVIGFRASVIENLLLPLSAYLAVRTVARRERARLATSSSAPRNCTSSSASSSPPALLSMRWPAPRTSWGSLDAGSLRTRI